jgi:hypothetical protein
VQTFLPYPDFEATAEVLGDRRLGNQRVEVLQICASSRRSSTARALGRRTPAEAFSARPKAARCGPPGHDGHYGVRHDRVHAGGVITLRHDSWLLHIGLGRRHAGARVLMLVHDLHVA